MSITTTRMLRGIKRRITQPANQILMSNDDLLELADDIMQIKMVPLMLSIRENYFVTTATQSITADLASYDLPYRSIGRGLRDVKYSVDGTTTGIRNLTQIPLEEAHIFAETGQPTSFYFQGDKIIIVPAPVDNTQYILFYVEFQPSRLVQASDAAQVSSISIGVSTTTVTCTTVPSTMTAGVLVDFVQEKAGNSILAFDKSITNVSGTQLTFAVADAPSSLVVGDYIALAQESPVMQLPDEAYPLFETYVCERVLDALGDREGASKLREDGAIEERNFKIIVEPRIIGEPKKFLNRNGLLRGKGFMFWRSRGFYS